MNSPQLTQQLSPTSSVSAPEAANEQRLDALSALCKASGDPLRLLVLRVLQRESFGVSELCQVFDIRQPALSHHLKILAAAGLVATRREGNSIFYRRAELGQSADLAALQQSLFQTVDQLQLPETVELALEQLKQQHADNSRSFFQDNAHKFRQQQDLIASYDQYAGTVAQVLQDAPIKNFQLALEVGPGDGAFLPHLSQRFENVIALDNAAEMLAKAQDTAKNEALANVQFILGDTRSRNLSQALDNGKTQCIVVNMVLHHTPSPAEIFKDLAQHLSNDGVLLVTDLCEHDQAWARENCGDLWLGFDPEDLSTWAQDAGLQDIASVYLAQRNGFKIQVRLFGHAVANHLNQSIGHTSGKLN